MQVERKKKILILELKVMTSLHSVYDVLTCSISRCLGVTDGIGKGDVGGGAGGGGKIDGEYLRLVLHRRLPHGRGGGRRGGFRDHGDHDHYPDARRRRGSILLLVGCSRRSNGLGDGRLRRRRRASRSKGPSERGRRPSVRDLGQERRRRRRRSRR